MATKTCTKCNKTKPLNQFDKKGTKYIYNFCSECRRKYMRKHYLSNKKYYIDKSKESDKRKRLWLDTIKNKPCKDCGKSYPPYIMEFDHLKDKKFTISNSFRLVSKTIILKEIAKCELVCANCHRERTHQRVVRLAGLEPA